MTVNLPSQDDRDASSRTVAERLLPLLPIGAAMFTLSALVYYHLRHSALDVRSPLQLLVAWTYRTFGFAPAFLGCLLLLTWGSIWFAAGRCTRVGSRLLRLAATVVMLGVFLNLGDGGVNSAFHKGELGAWLAGGLVGALGYYPSVLVVWATTVGALLLATDFFFRDEFERMRAQPASAPERGVESEVTEVLKGLGANEPAAAAAVVPAAAQVAPPSAEVTRELSVGRYDDEVDFEPAVEPSATTRARPSYYERRYAAVADQDDWTPQEPESQEIDNAESAEADAFAAEPAVIDESAQVADEEVFVIAEASTGSVDATDPVVAEAEADAEFDAEIAAEIEDEGEAEVADAAEATSEAAAADADDVAPIGGGMAQRSLFDEPPPAPRAPLGEWRQDYEVPAAAASSDVDATETEDAEADDWSDEFGDEVELEVTEGAVEEGTAAADDFADEDFADEEEADEGEFADEGENDEPESDELADEDESADEAEPQVVAAAEPPPVVKAPAEAAVPIPRPAKPPAAAAATGRYPAALVEDATALVVESGRASAALLQRKLRIDFDTALGLLAELSRLGVVELSADAVHGRVLR